MRLDAATLTNPGLKRRKNEDHVWAQVYTSSQGDAIGLFIVCDGMGGHLGGECASYWAIEAIKQELSVLFCPEDPRATLHLPREQVDAAVAEKAASKTKPKSKRGDVKEMILEAVQKANQVVYDYAQQKPQKAADAGTTLTMAVIRGNLAAIANVGDSRTYLLREQQLEQVTQDHSLVASLVASGQLEPDEIYVHPQRSVIYRSLGQKQKVQVDIFWESLQPGDFLLLCSDGLWEMVRDEKVLARLIEEANSLEQACEELVEAANVAGGEDNIGIVLVKVK